MTGFKAAYHDGKRALALDAALTQLLIGRLG